METNQKLLRQVCRKNMSLAGLVIRPTLFHFPHKPNDTCSFELKYLIPLICLKNKFVGNAEAAAIILSRWPDKINKATRFGIEPIRWAILKADSKCFELLVNAHPDHPGTDLYQMDHN